MLDAVGWMVAVAAAVFAALGFWLCLALNRLARSGPSQDSLLLQSQLTILTREIAALSRAVRSTAEAYQSDRINQQALHVSFTLTGVYTGSPEQNLPGAVVVRVVNTSDGLLHQLIAEYRPTGDDPVLQSAEMLSPQSSTEWSFALFEGGSDEKQFGLRYTDARGTRWEHTADSPQPRHLDSGLGAWS